MLKLDKISIGERAYELIKELVLTKEITGKINQNEIAKKLDISRTPVVVALNRLVSEGFLELKPYKGFYVKKYSKKELEEINEVRVLLEILGIKKLIRNLSGKEVEVLKDFLQKFKSYYRKKAIGRYRNLDISFHNYIISQTKNQYIIKHLKDSIIIPDVSGAFIPIDTSLKQHVTLVESIISKDFKTAEKIIKEHIRDLIPN